MLYEITFQSSGGGIFSPLCGHDHAHTYATRADAASARRRACTGR